MDAEAHRGDDVASAKRVELAVFDLDGTCIDGESGLLFSTWLLSRRSVSLIDAARLLWWGIRYRTHLPHRQQEPREILIRALNKRHPDRIAELMGQFHDEVLLPRYRAEALDEVRRRKDEGMVTLLATATFYEVAEKAAAHLGVHGFIATESERDEEGGYTGRVLGEVIEGKGKLSAVVTWANVHFGMHGWRIACAYGDHHSDAQLLAAAREPYAVCPGKSLKSIAQKRSWTILDWSGSGLG